MIDSGFACSHLEKDPAEQVTEAEEDQDHGRNDAGYQCHHREEF